MLSLPFPLIHHHQNHHHLSPHPFIRIHQQQHILRRNYTQNISWRSHRQGHIKNAHKQPNRGLAAALRPLQECFAPRNTALNSGLLWTPCRYGALFADYTGSAWWIGHWILIRKLAVCILIAVLEIPEENGGMALGFYGADAIISLFFLPSVDKVTTTFMYTCIKSADRGTATGIVLILNVASI